jgi:hypothetical protein
VDLQHYVSEIAPCATEHELRWAPEPFWTHHSALYQKNNTCDAPLVNSLVKNCCDFKVAKRKCICIKQY